MTHDFHQQTTIAQFTKQAGAYTKISAHSNALEQLVQLSGVQVNDYVLAALQPGRVFQHPDQSIHYPISIYVAQK